MPELRNPRWERFCQNYVELGNASEAYRRAGYRDKGDNESISGRAARLLAFVGVRERITVLKAQKVFEASLERRELEGYFAAVIRTPAGELTPNHPLCQSIEVSDKGTKLRMPDKNAAAQSLARLNGYEVAQRVDVTIDNPLTHYLRALRSADAQAIDNQQP